MCRAHAIEGDGAHRARRDCGEGRHPRRCELESGVQRLRRRDAHRGELRARRVVGKAAKEALAKNLEGTRTALEAARDSGAKKIVYTSSIVVYGNTHGETVAEGWKPPRIEFPSFHPTFYAMSKARAHYDVAVPLMENGAPIVIVQPGGVFGPRDHSTFRAIWYCLAKGFPVPTGGAVYGVVDVEDCAMGHVLALEKGKPGECYHLVDENISLPSEFACCRAAAVAGLPARLVVMPSWMIAMNAFFTSIVERVIPLPDILSSDAARGMSAALTLKVTTQKAREDLGWTTRPMKDALRDVMADEMKVLGKKLTPELEAPKE